MSNEQADFLQWISFSSLALAPWKNGGGLTREIALHPPGASLTDPELLWRLSCADVSAPGPFSRFPDYDRLLTIVRGEELLLRFGKEQRSLRRGMVLHFEGEAEVLSELPSGPVRDLGLIYDRDRVFARMSLVEFSGRPRSFALSSPDVILHGLEGELGLAVYPGEREFRLGVGDSLRIGPHPAERLVTADPGSGRGRLCAVEISEMRVKSVS